MKIVSDSGNEELERKTLEWEKKKREEEGRAIVVEVRLQSLERATGLRDD